MLEYKVGTGSNSNVMPFNMFKVLFSKVFIVELAQYKFKKVCYLHVTINAFLN